MQKYRTLKFWDDFHENNEAKEWIVHPTPDLFDLIYSECSSLKGAADGRRMIILRVLEIGCGTSTMARDFWMHIESTKKEECSNLYIRSTDVSQVCVDTCLARDKDLANHPSGQFETATGARIGLEYSTLSVLETPGEADCGAWDVILDKGCLDTFLFRSRNRGENKAYPAVVATALDNIWTMLADGGVYLILSPRTKLKAVRDYAGFSSVNRAVQFGEKASLVSKKNNKPRVGDDIETCYMYVCHKKSDYVIGETATFRENYRILPMDDDKCPHCGLVFRVFRNGEDTDGRGVIFWTREWKNHCIHCKAPHTSKRPSESATR
jgi:SAM-dependent methyltransferase